MLIGDWLMKICNALENLCATLIKHIQYIVISISNLATFDWEKWFEDRYTEVGRWLPVFRDIFSRIHVSFANVDY